MDQMKQMTNDNGDNYSIYKLDLLKQVALNLETRLNEWYNRVSQQI